MSVQKFEGSSWGKLNTAWVLRETVRGYGDDGEWAEGAKMMGSGGSVDRSSAGLSARRMRREQGCCNHENALAPIVHSAPLS